MAKQTINNAELASLVRSKINANFTELYESVVSVPASATASGIEGQIAYDSTYIYLCVSANTWVRAPLVLETWV